MKRLKHFFIGNKYGLSLIVIAFAIAVCLLTGTTYGLWRLNFTQTTPNVVSTACFDMTFTELTPSVNLQNAYPISDAQGLETTPYTFKINNTCTQYGTYVIRLDILNTSTMSADKIKVQLEGASTISPTILSTLETNSILELGISSSKVILSDSLFGQEEKEYSLRLWIDSTAGNELMNQQFSGRLVIDTIATEEPCTNCGTLKVSETNPGETATFLNSPSPVLRNNIESIVFADHKTVPVTSLGSWDVSSLQDNSVIAWYEDADTDSKYEITIGSIGGVKGNIDSSYLFRDIRNIDSIDLTYFYTHEVADMYMMFYDAGENNTNFSLILGDNFDTSSVINMSLMFPFVGRSNPNFTLDLGDNFDTSNVTNMSTMFTSTGRSSTVFKLDLGDKFNTSNVTNMIQMFSNAGYNSTVFTLDLGDKFDTSKVTNMVNMFSGTGYSNPNFVLDLRNFSVNATPTTNATTIATGKTTHKLYASSSNISFMSGKGFTGTIINCTTSPASCP